MRGTKSDSCGTLECAQGVHIYSICTTQGLNVVLLQNTSGKYVKFCTHIAIIYSDITTHTAVDHITYHNYKNKRGPRFLCVGEKRGMHSALTQLLFIHTTIFRNLKTVCTSTLNKTVTIYPARAVGDTSQVRTTSGVSRYGSKLHDAINTCAAVLTERHSRSPRSSTFEGTQDLILVWRGLRGYTAIIRT